MIRLINDTIDQNDLDLLSKWLLTNPRLTKGELTEQFESEFAKYLGIKHAIFVNSGSSANLLMFYYIKENIRNNKVVIPDISWATDLAPCYQFGLEPILCPPNMDDLSVDLNCLEDIFIREQPGSLVLVSVLGLCPNMDAVLDLCSRYSVMLVEDACESLGTRYGDAHLGTFGLMSSFSFYRGHHMSTIEGGMICTNDEDIYELLKMYRSHGWSRDLKPETQARLKTENGTDDFNDAFTFYVPGFNVRATDLQAFIGLNQMKKIDGIVLPREANFRYFLKKLEGCEMWRPKIDAKCTCVSNFAYPVLAQSRAKLVEKLVGSGVECRPLISGAMSAQPFYRKRSRQESFETSELVCKNGLYVPNHPDLSHSEIDLMTDLIRQYHR